MKPIRPSDIQTPGLAWQRRIKRQGATQDTGDRYVGYWICRPDILARGYSLKTQRIWPPSETPDAMPSREDWEGIAAQCARLQAEMLEFSHGRATAIGAPVAFDNTVGSLIQIYMNDPDSPFQELRAPVRDNYRRALKRIARAVGSARVAPAKGLPGLTFRDFKRWSEAWRKPKREGGRQKVATAHSNIAYVRMVFSFGTQLDLPGCEKLYGILQLMRFENVKSRKQFFVAEQIVAIRTEAHRRGLTSIALGQAIGFEIMPRPKDVVGEYIPLSEPGISTIVHRGKKWLYGIRWEQIDANMRLTHRLSKSLRGRKSIADPEAGKTKTWTLTSFPMVMEELGLMLGVKPVDVRRDMLPASGPLIVAEHNGKPWVYPMYARQWRKIARALEIPDDIQFRDSRASGATEAELAGATPEEIRRGLGHSKVETTRIYTRGDDEVTDNVAHIRSGFRGQNKPKTP